MIPLNFWVLVGAHCSDDFFELFLWLRLLKDFVSHPPIFSFGYTVGIPAR